MTQPPLTLTELAARWAAKCHPGDGLVRQMRHVTHDLSMLVDVSDPRVLTPRDLCALQADLVAHYPRPIACRMFRLADALLQFGVSETLLATNPARGMTVTPPPAAAHWRCPFTPDDLTRIFSHQIFTAHALPPERCAGGSAAYWLPLVLLCTGERPDRAAALCTHDLRYSADAPPIAYWSFDTGTKTAGYRQPAHPILCRLGLLDYVGSLPPGSDLFPLLRPDLGGHRAGRFCRYLHRFLRQEVGIVEPCKGAYSFRLTFAHACRQAALPPDVTCALRGSALPYAYAGGCGMEVSLATLQQAMARLTFPGFPL